MMNNDRAILACIALTLFLIVPLGAAPSDEAEGPEDVPLLGEDLGTGEGSGVGNEPVNHPPRIVSLTSTPERPIAGIATQMDSKGIPVLAVIEAIGSDDDGDYPLEYRFAFYPGGETLGYSENNKVVIENGSSPGTQLVDVTVRDSRGLESETKSLWIAIQSAESATSSEEPGSASTTSGAGSEENKDLLNCLCRCWERGETYCSYNTTPYPTLKGGTESCGDLENGPCMCQGGVGCWRAPLPNEGECHDRCVELYGSPSGESGSPSSPGDPAAPASLGFIMEEEPNDQIGDANEIVFASPASVGGRIAPADDVDFYKFYAESPGILTVEFQSLPAEMKARIGLYGKNLNWIVNADASNPGDLVTLKKDAAGPGWNYIAISDIDRKAHSEDYTFEATFDPAPDGNEPNNEAGDATYVEADETVSGYICPTDDLDVYKFTADSSGVLKAKLTAVPEEMKPRIGLFGKSFNWIVNADASNAGDLVTLERGILGPGAYYVAVSDIDRRAHSKEYSLDLVFEEALDDREPNDEIGDAAFLEGDQTVVGYICPQDDVDFFGIYADHSGILKVSLTGVPQEMKPRIGLFGKSFSWIVNVDASNAGDAITLEEDVPGPGPCYFAISDIDRKAHSTGYSFDLVFEAAPDESEPNDQVGDATGAELGKTIVGYICPQDDVDIRAFSVDASGILKVELADVPDEMKPRIGLFGKNFNWIVNADASNAGDEITLERDVAEAGIYYVAISDIDRKAHSESYTMMAILKAG